MWVESPEAKGRMTRSDYYERVKFKARELRSLYGFTTPRVLLSDLRRICRAEGIKVDYWNGKLRRVRGLYSRDDGSPSIMVVKSIPVEQRIFTIAHELKHHFFYDEDLSEAIPHDLVEKSAEIFAVELIFPDELFLSALARLGVTKSNCLPEHIIRLKRDSLTTLSFGSLAKRAMFMGFAAEGSLAGVKWHNLQKALFGEPAHIRIQRYRRMRNSQ